MLVEVVFNLSLTGILWQLLPCRSCLNILFNWGINMRMVDLQEPDYIFWGGNRIFIKAQNVEHISRDTISHGIFTKDN